MKTRPGRVRRPDTVSLTQLTKLLNRTAETIRSWRKDGMPQRTENTRPRFVVAEVVEWLVERARRQALEEREPAGEGLSEREERTRKLRAEADLKELDLGERRRELIPARLYEERLEDFLGGFTAVAAGRIHSFERDIIQAETPADARRLTDRIHRSLLEGAQQYADQIEQEMQDLEGEGDSPSDDAAEGLA